MEAYLSSLIFKCNPPRDKERFRKHVCVAEKLQNQPLTQFQPDIGPLVPSEMSHMHFHYFA